MTLPIPFDFTVTEDRRGINFEGVEARHPDPEGALNLHLRVARDHLVLSVWPVKGEIAQVSHLLAQILGPPRSAPSVCGFGDCQDDDKDAPQQTTMWEFDPAARPEILGPPRSAPSVCGFGDCQDDDKDAPQQTTMWEFDPAARPEILKKVKDFLGLP